jgi:hypothetical protein
VDWLIAIVVALIGAGAGFAGGYFGARWKAGTDLAQWRRDRVLEFCGDYLAAGDELKLVGVEMKDGGNPSWPIAGIARLGQASGKLFLLSADLIEPVTAYNKALLELLKVARSLPKEKPDAPIPAIEAVSHAQAIFLLRASEVLTIPPQPPEVWRRLEAYLKKAW